jgi:hypothetical protein
MIQRSSDLVEDAFRVAKLPIREKEEKAITNVSVEI